MKLHVVIFGSNLVIPHASFAAFFHVNSENNRSYTINNLPLLVLTHQLYNIKNLSFLKNSS